MNETLNGLPIKYIAYISDASEKMRFIWLMLPVVQNQFSSLQMETITNMAWNGLRFKKSSL